MSRARPSRRKNCGLRPQFYAARARPCAAGNARKAPGGSPADISLSLECSVCGSLDYLRMGAFKAFIARKGFLLLFCNLRGRMLKSLLQSKSMGLMFGASCLT